MKKLKTAVFLTGSGGTISQEVAIIDQLIKQGKLNFDENETLLIGSGSGALTLVAINACFRKDNPCSWEDFYKDFIDTISDEETFIKVDPIHWITIPQRKKINELVAAAGFSRISDLPFNSVILTTSAGENKANWLKSNARKEKDLNLTDVLMASSAIPILFPTQQLNNQDDTYSTKFIGANCEGAMLGLFHKFRKQMKKIVLENGPFERIFIVSPSRLYDYNSTMNHDLSPMIPQEKYQINQFFNQISMHGFLTFLIKLQKANSKNNLAKQITVSIPESDDNFGLLDYSNQLEKYALVKNWLENNPDRLAVDISEYIKEAVYVPSFSDTYSSKDENALV
jgi:hypothetical protein